MLLMTSVTCTAISLVGVNINACNDDFVFSNISKAITVNIAVFPVPDFDLIIRSTN